MAKRQGMFLAKSRRRDPRAYDFGMYGLRDSHTGNWLTFDGLSLSLDQVADWLTDEPGPVFCGAEATISASAGRKGPKPGTGPVVRLR